ncbi:SH3 domain-containing protein [Streptomyces sp. CAU 1734]|uniref:SH3 domain-containing protein n=1 Tax=Streptomyces sp. CAU 1734 TaxID=3140360 RepID=UPI0032606464
MAALKRIAAVALSVSLLTGGALVLAPSASADSNCSTYDQGAEAKNGINFRTGPSTSYASKGLLYKADRLALYCKSGSWYKAKLVKRSKSGLKAGTTGWVRQDMIRLHLAG